MKTDLEKFIELYESIGMTITAESAYDAYNMPEGTKQLTFDESNTDTSLGSYFYVIHFDENGKFIRHSIDV